MKKIAKVFTVLLVLFTMFSLVGCGEKSIEDVQKGLEQDGYTVSASTIGGFGAIIASKDKEVVTVFKFDNSKDAEKSKESLETLASIGGKVSFKTQGSYIFYGTTDAVDAVAKIL